MPDMDNQRPINHTAAEDAGADALWEELTLEESGNKGRVTAALASAAVPGLGQWLLGRQKSGVVFFFVALACVLMYWPLRLPLHYYGFGVAVVAPYILCVASGWNALRILSPKSFPASHWWAVLVLPVALIAANAEGTWLLRASGFHVYITPFASMQDTLDQGDHFVVDLKAYRSKDPVGGDLVVARNHGVVVVKRVVAVAGDTIQGTNGIVVLNGAVLREPYAQSAGNPDDSRLRDFGPVRIPIGKLFVMGDNRDHSLDSRIPEFGLVDERELVGRPIYVYYSGRNRTGTLLR